MTKSIVLQNGRLESKTIINIGGNLSEDANKIISANSKGLVDSSLIPNDCIKPWIENVQYYENDVVIRNNKIYRATQNTQTNYFDTDIWTQLTGYLTEDTVTQHITQSVLNGAHDMPIITEEHDGKVLTIVNGQYSLIDINDLGLEILNIGPNMPSVYTPAAYAAVQQPVLFDMKYYHPLGTANAGVRIDVFEILENDILRAIYSTDWLPPLNRWIIPYGVFDYAAMYLAKIKHRDMSGRVSEEKLIYFKILPPHLNNIYFAKFVREYNMYDRMDVGLSEYLYIDYYKDSFMNGPTDKPGLFEILSDHSSIYISDDISYFYYTDFLLSNYQHNMNFDIQRIITRFRDENNNFYASNNIRANIDLNQIYLKGLEANKDYVLQIFRTDMYNNSTLKEIPVKTYNVTHLRKNQINLSQALTVTEIPILSLNIDTQEVKNLWPMRKPEKPIITNPDTFMYIKPTDEFNFKGDEIISFTYEHLDAITMKNCVVRFKKGQNEYHASQEFFGSNTNLKLYIDKLQTNTDYALELYVMDQYNNYNSTTIPCITMPPGQYISKEYQYTYLNDINIQNSGILYLNIEEEKAKHIKPIFLPDKPIIINPEKWEFLHPTDDINFNGSEDLSFIYTHPKNIPLNKVLVRFKKEQNVYHNSQIFFGSSTNLKIYTHELEPNTQYTMEIYVIDNELNVNSQELFITILPSGQYNSSIENYIFLR